MVTIPVLEKELKNKVNLTLYEPLTHLDFIWIIYTFNIHPYARPSLRGRF